MDEFAVKLRKNAPKMELDKMGLSIDEIIDFERQSFAVEFCEAFEKELDIQVEQNTKDANTKNVRKCQKLQLEAIRFKNVIFDNKNNSK